MNKDNDRYFLGRTDAAIVFHEDMSFEMVLPKMSDDDTVDSNSNTFFVIALALAMRRPEFMEMVDDQRAMMQRQMEEGCSPEDGCPGCGGGCNEDA
jgi:hypothetical protein